MKSAYVKDLAVDLKTFRLAYEFLKENNYLYRYVSWTEDAESCLQEDELGMRLPRALSSCVRRVDRLDDAPLRQEGPADAVAQDDPPVGGSSHAASGSEEWARATTDAEDESNTGASDVEKPVEQPKVRKKGVRFKRKEQGEYCAGVDDEDMKMDTERQFLKVQIHMRRLAVRCAEKAAREKAVGGDFTCKAGEDAVREEMESLRAAAAKTSKL